MSTVLSVDSSVDGKRFIHPPYDIYSAVPSVLPFVKGNKYVIDITTFRITHWIRFGFGPINFHKMSENLVSGFTDTSAY